MSEIELTVERWDQFWPEAEPLMIEHNLEVGLRDPRIPFNVDVESARLLDRADVLHIITARYEGVLIGYGIWFTVPNLASKDVHMAQQGPWFVLPEYRNRTGKKIWDLSIMVLRNRGIKLLHVHHSMLGEGPRLEKFFVDVCGAIPVEMVYAMWIGDN